jgi:hypothetical protein
MVRIHRFVNEYDVNYYRQKTDEEIKSIIDFFPDSKGRKPYGFPDGDMDVLLTEFRSEGFTSLTRKNDWRNEWVCVLNNNGEVYRYKAFFSEFYYINKWGQEERAGKYRIICDDKLNILWIGHYKDRRYFISIDTKIYEFWYEHKTIKLCPYTISVPDVIKTADEAIYFDTAIIDHDNSTILINLDEYFEKGFFYKGPKWNLSWKDILFPNDITIFNSISTENFMFRIEIENITYPYIGYVLLDLNEFKIMKGGKII